MAADKMYELLITILAGLAGLCMWIVRRLWGRIDTIESRVDNLYQDRLKKSDLDKIIDIQHLILQNLLTKRKNKNGEN